MENKIFSGVEDTLFIPLMARIYISKRFPQYFFDKKALSLENIIPANLITQKSSEYSMVCSASRATIMDKTVSEFISKHEKSNIVCIGCGLETMAWRLEHLADKTHFYEIDFATVIENRKAILGVLNNETLIAGNANTLNFAEYMDCKLPTLFVVAGVFQYFKEDEVLALINTLKSSFNNAQILFDATDEVGIKYAQKYVKKTGNTSAMMYFYINDANAFAHKANLKLISVSGFYGGIGKELKRQMKLYTRIAMKVADDKKRTIILHLEF